MAWRPGSLTKGGGGNRAGAKDAQSQDWIGGDPNVTHIDGVISVCVCVCLQVHNEWVANPGCNKLALRCHVVASGQVFGGLLKSLPGRI